MQLNSKLGDLFSSTNEYAIAHCISSDFALGAGIALDFNRKFNSKMFLNNVNSQGKFPNCIRQRNSGKTIYHLVTKSKYWHKPTYGSLRESLTMMKKNMLLNNETKLAIPKLGCGLDGLDWKLVRGIIEEIFKDTDIEILVYFI